MPLIIDQPPAIILPGAIDPDKVQEIACAGQWIKLREKFPIMPGNATEMYKSFMYRCIKNEPKV